MGQEHTLDDIDKRILRSLQSNARQPLSTLGAQVKLTKAAVSKRIRNLTKAGYIEGLYYKLNPDKMGKQFVMITSIRCDRQQSKGEALERIAGKIAELSGVQSVYLVFGENDIIVTARGPDKEWARDILYGISQVRGVVSTNTVIPYLALKESFEIEV